MNEKELSYGILRAIGILLGVVFLLYFLYEIQSVLLYIAVAGVISLVGRPVVIFLRNRLRLPNKIAVVMVLLLVVSMFIGLITIFIPIVVEQSKNLGQIDMDAFTRDLNELNTQINNYLGVDEIDIIEGIKQTEFARNFDLSTIPTYLNNFFGILGAAAIAVFSVIFISFFFLKDSKLMLNSILVFANQGHEEKFQRVFNKIKILLSRYFVGLTLQITVLFVLYSILLSIFEIDNPIAIAFICAFLNIIPYLGPIIAGILISLFVISSNLGADFQTIILPQLIYVMSGYIICQLIDNFINQPLIFGASVRSHPLEIFLVILIAGLTSGIMGMIVAVPFYTAIKVIAKESLSEYKIVKRLTRDL
ncbi:Predicted PurR-regulated permease PerM [Salinimicrobium catena]|uniref:Predicted PurR-regulated permease PerM n=1 Tax=Salinimicrobium catena TaxID=390640 RepID=A0A1H5LQ69_9FLAO|nr:AI-2E family transporter [Salinimicrobium catena]SDL11814.1 Predicted PurR-regulated permease PerM [Salinimicrobium catena]SEE78338.1 Predicted PurR-regulated permease PerM [Salinimicrobium catena]